MIVLIYGSLVLAVDVDNAMKRQSRTLALCSSTNSSHCCGLLNRAKDLLTASLRACRSGGQRHHR